MSSPTEIAYPFEQSAAAEAEQAARRARRSARLFGIVLMAAIVIGIVMIARFAGFGLPSGKIAGEIELAPEKPGQGVSYKAEIKGSDEKQQPFKYQADKGFEDKDNRDLIHLETFTGTMRQSTGSDLQISGSTGLYDRTSKKLNLEGNVAIDQGGKFNATMDKAEFDVEKRSLASKSPVKVKTQTGNIAADSLVSNDNGEKLVFKGNVKARFE
jgi:lipopolysaccharide export system protein LptC